jgi:hypothetical protein
MNQQATKPEEKLLRAVGPPFVGKDEDPSLPIIAADSRLKVETLRPMVTNYGRSILFPSAL